MNEKLTGILIANYHRQLERIRQDLYHNLPEECREWQINDAGEKRYYLVPLLNDLDDFRENIREDFEAIL